MPNVKKEPTEIDVLKRMKQLLRKGWTQGWFARNAEGGETQAGSPDAVAFCLAGANLRAMRDLNADGGCRAKAERLIQLCVPATSYVEYNDAPERKKSEIIAVVDCAIKASTGAAL